MTACGWFPWAFRLQAVRTKPCTDWCWTSRRPLSLSMMSNPVTGWRRVHGHRQGSLSGVNVCKQSGLKILIWSGNNQRNWNFGLYKLGPWKQMSLLHKWEELMITFKGPPLGKLVLFYWLENRLTKSRLHNITAVCSYKVSNWQIINGQ